MEEKAGSHSEALSTVVVTLWSCHERSLSYFMAIKWFAAATFIYFTFLAKRMSSSHSGRNDPNQKITFQWMLVLSPGTPTHPHECHEHLATETLAEGCDMQSGGGLVPHLSSSLPFSRKTACCTLMKTNIPSWICSLYVIARILLYRRSPGWTKSWLIKLRANGGQLKTAVCACDSLWIQRRQFLFWVE